MASWHTVWGITFYLSWESVGWCNILSHMSTLSRLWIHSAMELVKELNKNYIGIVVPHNGSQSFILHKIFVCGMTYLVWIWDFEFGIWDSGFRIWDWGSGSWYSGPRLLWPTDLSEQLGSAKFSKILFHIYGLRQLERKSMNIDIIIWLQVYSIENWKGTLNKILLLFEKTSSPHCASSRDLDRWAHSALNILVQFTLLPYFITMEWAKLLTNQWTNPLNPFPLY